MDCLTNIVGISDTDCPCWDDTKPVDFATINASSSGLFILSSDVVPVNMANAATSCETGSIWDLAIKARATATRDFIADFTSAVMAKNVNKFKPFSRIGDNYRLTGSNLNSGNTVAGFYIEPYKIKGGSITINSIDLAFVAGVIASTDIEIFIYSSLDLDTPLVSAIATITANKITATATLAVPYELSLNDIRMDLDEKIYFVYEVPTGFKPYNNKNIIGCGCSGRGRELEDNPYLRVMSEINGIQAVDIASLGSGRVSSTIHGLTVNTVFNCDYYSWLCGLTTNPNVNTVDGYVNLGMALADALNARAKMYLLDTIYRSGRINYYTMVLDGTVIVDEINRQSAIYERGLANLTYPNYMPSDVTDCLMCRDNKSIQKSIINI